MTHADLPGVLRQEQTLIFSNFDENTAFTLLGHARDLALAEGVGVGVLVKFWDRPLAFGSTPGYTHGNYLWAHRKANTVRLVLKSSYRVRIEQDRQLFEDRWGVSAEEYAISGGAFPITVRGAGIVGAAVVSGLDERDDHRLITAAIARTLGLDPAEYALPG
ncbi:MAG: heme-binding protein [Alphaproteobacteria bacterium]|nr:heme-binding protein [Alphaproteobacteria bacterium]